VVRPESVGRYLFLRFPSDNLALGTESTIADYLNVLALANGGTLVLEGQGLRGRAGPRHAGQRMAVNE
jgi:hypothetical protein